MNLLEFKYKYGKALRHPGTLGKYNNLCMEFNFQCYCLL